MKNKIKFSHKILKGQSPMPFFSVVIPTYNREQTILRAIYSVLNQSFFDFEIIIVDDKSTDNTINIINSLNTELIKVFKQEINKGANAARNRGIYESCGEWIAFLDSDDEWSIDHLKSIYIYLKENPTINFVCTGGYIIYDENHIKQCYPITSGGYIYEQEIMKDLLMPTSCVAVKKNVLENVNGFDIQLPARQDYDLWIRISKEYPLGIIHSCSTKIYWDNHPHIGSNYNRYVKGTIIIVNKLLQDPDISDNTKKKLYGLHYYAIAKSCANNGSYKEGKSYIKKALYKDFSVSYLLLFLLLKIPFLYKIARSLKHSVAI